MKYTRTRRHTLKRRVKKRRTFKNRTIKRGGAFNTEGKYIIPITDQYTVGGKRYFKLRIPKQPGVNIILRDLRLTKYNLSIQPTEDLIGIVTHILNKDSVGNVSINNISINDDTTSNTNSINNQNHKTHRKLLVDTIIDNMVFETNPNLNNIPNINLVDSNNNVYFNNISNNNSNNYSNNRTNHNLKYNNNNNSNTKYNNLMNEIE